MKLHFSKRDKLIIGVGALLLVVLIIYAQFFILTPLKSDKGIKQQSLKSEQKLLDIVSQKKVDTAQTSTEDTRVLQKKIPVQPLQEQFILDLEKAETVSNSQISSMNFSKDAGATTAGDTANTQNASGQQNSSTNQNGANNSTTSQQTGPAAPTGLEKLTVQLSVESPTYEELEKFIETLESLTRIVVVEAIAYSGGQEITSLDQEDQPISYSLTISAYYMPVLADLQAQLPKIDAPAPVNKENPLSQFSNITNSH
jgi:type IV pilus assembly protein PilO